jgi:hypothetical protein
MKKIFSISLLLVLIISACKKDSTTPAPPAPTKTQLLTKNTWQVEELISQYGNTQGEYKKGGINTTGSDYSKYRITFSPNGTGSFTDPLNHTYTFTWNFVSGDETKMTIIANYPTPATLNYSFVNLDGTRFTYTIHYMESGNYALATASNIPFP